MNDWIRDWMRRVVSYLELPLTMRRVRVLAAVPLVTRALVEPKLARLSRVIVIIVRRRRRRRRARRISVLVSNATAVVIAAAADSIRCCTLHSTTFFFLVFPFFVPRSNLFAAAAAAGECTLDGSTEVQPRVSLCPSFHNLHTPAL